MRCVIVNGSTLKANSACALCGNRIGDNYIRAIGSRQTYCNYQCYSVAADSPILTLGYRAPARGAWTQRS